MRACITFTRRWQLSWALSVALRTVHVLTDASCDHSTWSICTSILIPITNSHLEFIPFCYNSHPSYAYSRNSYHHSTQLWVLIIINRFHECWKKKEMNNDEAILIERHNCHFTTDLLRFLFFAFSQITPSRTHKREKCEAEWKPKPHRNIIIVNNCWHMCAGRAQTDDSKTPNCSISLTACTCRMFACCKINTPTERFVSSNMRNRRAACSRVYFRQHFRCNNKTL